jgi:hypothetical protein
MLYAAQGHQLQGETKQDTIVFKTASNVPQLRRIMQTKEYKAEGKRFSNIHKHDSQNHKQSRHGLAPNVAKVENKSK